MSTIHGTVWWNELMTRDVPATKRYYEDVCGWQWETVPMPPGEYHIASAHGRRIAGMMDMSGLPGQEDLPAHWFTYFAVDDLEAALAAAKDDGGTVIRPPYEVPNIGTISIVRDAGGAALGVMVPVEAWDPPESGNGGLENVPV